MHFPQSVVGADLVRQHKYAVNLHVNDKVAAKEYRISESGSNMECYVQVAPGDRLSLSYEFPSGADDFADLVVDGVTRQTHINNQIKVHKYHFKEVGHIKDLRGKRKEAFQFYYMDVQNRNTDHDDNKCPPNKSKPIVGTIELLIYRRIKGVVVLGGSERAPKFNERNYWWKDGGLEVGNRDTHSLEIGFGEGRKVSTAQKTRITENHSDYQILATFKYKYHTRAELKAMGILTPPLKYQASDPSDFTSQQSQGHYLPAAKTSRSSIQPSIAIHSTPTMSSTKKKSYDLSKAPATSSSSFMAPSSPSLTHPAEIYEPHALLTYGKTMSPPDSIYNNDESSLTHRLMDDPDIETLDKVPFDLSMESTISTAEAVLNGESESRASEPPSLKQESHSGHMSGGISSRSISESPTSSSKKYMPSLSGLGIDLSKVKRVEDYVIKGNEDEKDPIILAATNVTDLPTIPTTESDGTYNSNVSSPQVIKQGSDFVKPRVAGDGINDLKFGREFWGPISGPPTPILKNSPKHSLSANAASARYQQPSITKEHLATFLKRQRDEDDQGVETRPPAHRGPKGAARITMKTEGASHVLCNSPALGTSASSNCEPIDLPEAATSISSTPVLSEAGSSIRDQVEQKKAELALAESRRAQVAAKLESRKEMIRKRAESKAAQKLKQADEKIAKAVAEAEAMEAELRLLEEQGSSEDDGSDTDF